MKKYWKVTLFSDGNTYTYVQGVDAIQAIFNARIDTIRVKSVVFAKGYTEKMNKESKYKLASK